MNALPDGVRAWLLRHRKLYIAGAAAIVAQQAMLAARDLMVRVSVDGIAARDLGAAARAAQWMLLATLCAAALRMAGRVSIFTAGARAERLLRARLLERMLAQGSGFFRGVSPGEAMSRATHDVMQVRGMLSLGVNNAVYSLTGLVSALAVMLHLSWRLTLAALVVTPGLTLARRLLARQLYTRQREVHSALGALSGRVFHSLSGVRVIRAFGLEPAERATFATSNARHLDALISLAWVRAALIPVLSAVASVGVLTVFAYGGHMVSSGALSWGEFAAFWVALLRLMGPLMGLGLVAAVVQRGLTSLRRLQAVFHAVPELVDGPRVPAGTPRGEVEVRGLSLALGGRDVLRGVSLDVPAGSSVAILGRTGSGKSTLAHLLARLAPAPRGTLFLDGVDVCDLPLAYVRRNVAYAPQDSFLFSTSAERNAGYALDGAGSPDAVLEALGRAQVLAEMRALPRGLATQVGERGVQLSGGQRQRLALARALARPTPVLVLDDPLSAVDAGTEAAILAGMDEWAHGRTTILFTHRTTAARRCGQIVLLDDGRVVERGTHDALMAAGGRYAALVREQALESEAYAPARAVG